MKTVSFIQLNDNLTCLIEQVVSNHKPIKVTLSAQAAVVVMSADDWEREQETLYVLQNSSLMQQIAESQVTHGKQSGYRPSSEELDALTGL